MLSEEFRISGQNFSVSDVTITTSINSVAQVLGSVRSKFLELMLAIGIEFPGLTVSTNQSPEVKQEVNRIINIYMTTNHISNTGHGATVNTGNQNQINSASGNDISQEIVANPDVKSKVEEALAQVKSLLDQNLFTGDDKVDIEQEIVRIRTQLEREKPRKTIIQHGLGIIQSLILSVAGNAVTGPVLQTLGDALTMMELPM